MQNSSSFPSFSEELYQRCTSANLVNVHEGFQQLGNCLLTVARIKLNKARFDDTFVADCVQQALREIWEQMQKGNGANSPDSFLAWASIITLRRCSDRIRYEGRRQFSELTIEMEEAVGSEEETIEFQILLDEKKVALLLNLRQHAKLSDKSKIVLINGFLFEQTDSELGRVLLTPQDNVRVIRHRNLDKLRRDVQFIALLQS